MSNFIDRLLGRDQRSARQAKERMKLVLIHDRTDLTPGALESLERRIDRGDLPVYRDRSKCGRHPGLT